MKSMQVVDFVLLSRHSGLAVPVEARRPQLLLVVEQKGVTAAGAASFPRRIHVVGHALWHRIGIVSFLVARGS
jgi:hypothetical protein